MKISKILIAVDESKYSEHAAEYGFELAHLCKAEVGLVNIVEPLIVPVAGPDVITGSIFEPPVATDPELMNIQKEASENVIDRIIKHFAGGLKITQFSEYGSKADGILSCSNQFNADLIVIGTHSRTGLDRLLMGSIAEDVVRHSAVPVLVVPFVESESPHKSA
jgi:nucleotide-binding universal stress UspA family protein